MRVGQPGRALSDLELALGFGAAVRWYAQFNFVRARNDNAARNFAQNYASTAAIAALMSIAGAAEDNAFVGAVRRQRPEFQLTTEVRSVLGIAKSTDQHNHLVNAVVIATQQFVKQLLTGSESAVVKVLMPLSAEQQVSLAAAWIGDALRISTAEAFLPTETLSALRAEVEAFDMDEWNDFCDQGSNLSTLVTYVVDKLSPEMEKLAREQGFLK